ncbi:hypothetical protein [Microbacterium enclense]|nr:hypothetical protein [Microbacterium enclense]
MNVLNRRFGRHFIATVAVSAAIIATTVINPHDQARATDDADDATISSQEVGHALEGVNGGLVRDAVTQETTVETGTASLEVEIPAEPMDGVRLTAGDFSLKIGLPNAAGSQDAAPTADGAVAYPSEGDSANAVIPVRGGVQLLSVIENEDADEHFAYPLTLPADHSLVATADGGARVVDATGTVKAAFEPAWAKDAAGRSIPTHYSISGNTLTQVVEHRGVADISYPVVADPLPVILIVVTAAAAIVVAALALGVATWIVVSWWNNCRSRNMYPELSTRNGFTARCVR